MQQVPKVYVLSGLGVDHRVFADIDFGDYEIIHIPWLQPQAREPIAAYAARLAALITDDAPTLIGLSFGGIMAREIARIIPCKKIILIASAKNQAELPVIYRLIGKTKLHQLVPGFLFTYSGWLTECFFGVKTEEEKKLLAVILKETDPIFRSWAINALLTWNNKEQAPENTVSIHGSKDRLIPGHNVAADFIVPGAGHFLTLTHAAAISVLLRKVLKQ
ncbi:MAG: alpha/beta hydrolase [Sphingobacteriales bacterium]|nr:MAG: alpha/beta hydrolase [Sphingobacteriales bacterium]